MRRSGDTQRRHARYGSGRCRFRAGRRHAFSLIELIVVTGLVAVLLALANPALTKARVAARRTQCLNNLRNVSLALIHFETAHGRLPASGNFFDNDGSIAPHHNWAVTILPWVAQSPLFERCPTSHVEQARDRVSPLPLVQPLRADAIM